MTIKGQFFDGESPQAHEVVVTATGSFLSVTYLQNGFRKEQSFRISELSVQSDNENVILSSGQKILTMASRDWREIGPSPSETYRKLLIPGLMVVTIFLSAILFRNQLIDALTALVPEVIMDQAAKDARETYKKQNCLSVEQERIVESVFMRLGKNKDEYEFYLIASPVQNAFAMPGKILVFHDSLLKDLNSLEAFAGILAHEIAHQEKDHLKKQIVKGLLLNYAFFAVMNGSGGGDILKEIVGGKFNQSEEQEADEEAARSLAQARINPEGVKSFFKKHQSKEDPLTKYLVLSHPDYGDRIKTFTPASKSFVMMPEADWKILSQGCHSNL